MAELLGADRVAVYLREDGRLVAAAARALAGPHEPVAERLLELALGPYRGRGIVVSRRGGATERLRGVAGAARRAGIEAALAVPLARRDEVDRAARRLPARAGLLTENESTLLAALAAQLAVAVQNARLHERATRLGGEPRRPRVRAQGGERLEALYEISRSFAQSLSLEATLDALARTSSSCSGSTPP